MYTDQQIVEFKDHLDWIAKDECEEPGITKPECRMAFEIIAQLEANQREIAVDRIRITPGIDSMYRVWVDDLVVMESDSGQHCLEYVRKVKESLMEKALKREVAKDEEVVMYQDRYDYLMEMDKNDLATLVMELETEVGVLS